MALPPTLIEPHDRSGQSHRSCRFSKSARRFQETASGSRLWWWELRSTTSPRRGVRLRRTGEHRRSACCFPGGFARDILARHMDGIVAWAQTRQTGARGMAGQRLLSAAVGTSHSRPESTDSSAIHVRCPLTDPTAASSNARCLPLFPGHPRPASTLCSPPGQRKLLGRVGPPGGPNRRWPRPCCAPWSRRASADGRLPSRQQRSRPPRPCPTQGCADKHRDVRAG